MTEPHLPQEAPDPAPRAEASDPQTAGRSTSASLTATEPLAWALGVTLLVTALSYLLPASFAATGVGAVFFLASYWLVLRQDTSVIREYGLSFGGLLEPEALNLRRLLNDSLMALSWAVVMAMIFFPPFWLGFLWWWQPHQAFDFAHSLDILVSLLGEEGTGQLLVIALPEEMFYRGYLQPRLERVLPPRSAVLGARVGLAVVITSAIFAVGHLATALHPSRLAVFFPSLLFGWLTKRSGGVGAAVVFHAACNLFASYLARSYAL